MEIRLFVRLRLRTRKTQKPKRQTRLYVRWRLAQAPARYVTDRQTDREVGWRLAQAPARYITDRQTDR